MAFAFQIRPLSSEQGYELSCDGILPQREQHGRLLHALLQAVQLGRHLPAEVQIFDSRGVLMETLPLGSRGTLRQAFHACHP